MTPQDIGAIIDRLAVNPPWSAMSRHDVAVETLAGLRRRGELEEPPPLSELPPHPDLPVKGEWVREMFRYRHQDKPTSVWHMYSGHHEEDASTANEFKLWTICNRRLRIFDWSSSSRHGEHRQYLDRFIGVPDGACKRCLQAIHGSEKQQAKLARITF